MMPCSQVLLFCKIKVWTLYFCTPVLDYVQDIRIVLSLASFIILTVAVLLRKKGRYHTEYTYPYGPSYKYHTIFYTEVWHNITCTKDILRQIWHSEDRALWYILIIKPTRCTNFSDLFWNRTLPVSDRFSAHHQESSTVHTAIGICHWVPSWSC